MNDNNNERKQKNIEKAIKHVEQMDYWRKRDIDYSVNNSIVYRQEVQHKIGDIVVEHKTITEAIAAHAKFGCKCCVLNFASYKYPGGGFLKGSYAQEEALCHDSTLYNVLSDKRFEKEYEQNRQDLNRGLYHNMAIYSRYVTFVRKDNDVIHECDVLTCAAPNRSAALKAGVTEEENLQALEERVCFVLDIMKENGVDIVFLGAWGCGVFGQDPAVVAKLFKRHLSKYSFGKVIFAINDKEKYEVFKNVFGTV